MKICSSQILTDLTVFIATAKLDDHITIYIYTVYIYIYDNCFVGIRQLQYQLELCVCCRKKGTENTIVRDYVLPDYTHIKRGFIKSMDDENTDKNASHQVRHPVNLNLLLLMNLKEWLVVSVLVLCWLPCDCILPLERGSSVVECRTRIQVSPGSNPPLLPFRRLSIFVLTIDILVDSAV